MQVFKYHVTLHSFFQKPESFIVNEKDLKDLKEYAKENQYKAIIEEGEYILKNSHWFNKMTNDYI